MATLQRGVKHPDVLGFDEATPCPALTDLDGLIDCAVQGVADLGVHLVGKGCGPPQRLLTAPDHAHASDLVGDLLSSQKGMACLGDAPGLGYEPNLEPLRKYRV